MRAPCRLPAPLVKAEVLQVTPLEPVRRRALQVEQCERTVMSTSTPIPVTIVTGFLGSGKSTLLNNVLTERHGLRIAVVENEFGEGVGVESLIVKDGLGGKALDGYYELANGCVCCTARDDLVATMEALLSRPGAAFDHVLIELSGLASPGPVARAFWSDDGNECARFKLDGVVCIVDAARLPRQLVERGAAADKSVHAINEAALQIAFADVVLLNKADTCDAAALGAARAAASAINRKARFIETTRARADVGALLSLASLSPLNMDVVLGAENVDGGCCCTDGADAASDAHTHDATISSVVVRVQGDLRRDAFMRWAAALLWVDSSGSSTRVLRGKGVLSLAGETVRHIFQSVEETFDVTRVEGALGEWPLGLGSPPVRETALVLIGTGLKVVALRLSLAECL